MNLGFISVAIASIIMLLVSNLILYPQVTEVNILTSLRVTSLTTALPFLLVFIAKPLAQINIGKYLGQWVQNNSRYLWFILTISHLIHLYQIILYYQLGQSCNLTVWLVTLPLWIIMVIVSLIIWKNEQFFEQFYQGNFNKINYFLYGFGNAYIWLIFTIAFALSTAEKHLLFYNIPALILFLAGAIIQGIVRWRFN